jgi:N-acyl-L-homoserine lactone synthetase
MQVHVVSAQDRAVYADLLEQMHRQRARLFGEVLGWRGLNCERGLEVDAFDGPAATYLLAIDAAGAVRGSLRLLPTLGPHMLNGPLRHFIDGAPPQGPDVMEWTRHAPGLPEWSPDVTAAARLALHLGALEFALARGVRAYTAVLESWLIPRARAMGWACTPLGPRVRYGEGEAQAVLNPVSAAHLDMLRAKHAHATPVLAPPLQVAA